MMDRIALAKVEQRAFNWGNRGYGESTGLEIVIPVHQVPPPSVADSPNDTSLQTTLTPPWQSSL